MPADASSEMDSGDSRREDGSLPDATVLDAMARGDAESDAAAHAEDAAHDAYVDPDPPATQVTDYCAAIPRLQRAPVIDGVVDSQLNVLPLMPVGWTSSSPGVALPAHTTASYALAWLPEGLYAFVRVVDLSRLPPPPAAQPWHGDGVEIYFDSDGQFPMIPKYDNPGTVQIIVPAPVDSTTPSTRSMRFRDASPLTPWASLRFTVFPTADGYVFEGLVEADAVDESSLALSSGNSVGVNLSINVSASDEQVSDPDAGLTLEGLRLGQYFLRTIVSDDCGGLPFCNSGAFCSPTLIE